MGDVADDKDVDGFRFLEMFVAVDSSSMAVEDTPRDDDPINCWRACRLFVDDGYILVARLSLWMVFLVDADPVDTEDTPVDVGVNAFTVGQAPSKLKFTTRVANARTAAENSLRLAFFVCLVAALLLQLRALRDLFLLESYSRIVQQIDFS